MWICLNDAFFSIVAHRDQPDSLLVRARRAGDIEKYWPESKTFIDEFADYRHRAVIHREQVAQVVSQYLTGQLKYDNFKNSVKDHGLHSRYSSIWSTMYGLQSAYDEYEGDLGDMFSDADELDGYSPDPEVAGMLQDDDIEEQLRTADADQAAKVYY